LTFTTQGLSDALNQNVVIAFRADGGSNDPIDWSCPRPGTDCRRRIAGHDFRGRRPVRLVATAEEDRLGFRQLMP
jgi:hypothetical protein